MTRDDVIARLKSAESELRARGVAALFLYGSYARDEARPDSDLDVLVELSPDTRHDLISYMAPYLFLEEQFPGTDIGYGTRENIEPLFRAHVDRSAIRVF